MFNFARWVGRPKSLPPSTLNNFGAMPPGTWRRKAMRAVCLEAAAWLALCLAAIAGAQAPTVHYSPSIVTLGGGFSGAAGVAADDAGNVYVADTGNNVVKEIPVGCTSSSCVIPVGGGFNGPKGVGVDFLGDVYVADTGNNAVKEMPAGCASSSCAITLGSGFNSPTGIALDGNGDIFLADMGNNAVELFASNCTAADFAAGRCMVYPQGGGFRQPAGVASGGYVADTGNNAVKAIPAGCYSSSCVTTLGGGFNGPQDLATGGGNVYVADTGNNAVKEMPADCASSSCTTALGSGFNGPAGIAVDWRGNVYVADSGNNAVKEIQLSSVRFSAEPVRTTSSVTTLTFTFDTGGTIGTPAVVPVGARGLDFADAGTGSCTTNGSGYQYNPGDTCTVDVTFTPRFPGMRNGAVELVDTSAAKNVLATVLVYGVGTAPQVVFSPATQTVLASGPANGNPQGVAVDGAGNVYFADNYNSAVKEIPAGCASSSCAITLGGGFNSPTGIAVDGAGNVYVADSGNAALKEIPAGCLSSSCVATLGGSIANTSQMGMYGNGVAVDGSGNLYVTTGANVWEMPANCTAGEICFTGLGFNFGGASTIAVDGNGNVYVGNMNLMMIGEPYGVWGLIEMPADCTGTNCVNEPVSGALITESVPAVALDSSGNIYAGIASGVNGSSNINATVEAPAGCASFSCVITLSDLVPAGLAVDDGGNVFMIHIYNSLTGPPWNPMWELIELNRAMAPTLSFPTPTPVGATDSADDPQTATVQNIGNAALTFPLPSSGTNPSVSANFAWDDAASTCTQTGAGSGAAFTLAAGASCTVAIDFAPTAVGAIQGSVSLTDNSLYVPGNTTQAIPLNGEGIPATPAITAWPTASPITYGQTLALSALTGGTASIAGAFAWTTPTTAPGAGSQSESVTFTPTDSTDYSAVTGTVTVTVNKAAATVTLGALNRTYTGSPLSATATTSPAGLTVAFTYNGSSTAPTSAGSYTVVATVNDPDYQGSATGTMAVAKATPGVALTSSLNPALTQNAVTLTATVSSPASTPSGSVTFFDGATALGSAVALNSDGAAALTITSLPIGNDSLTAVYSGDANFAAGASNPVSEIVEDFSLSIASSGSNATSVTVVPGQAGTFQLTISPVAPATTFPAAISFSATGLPPGSTYTITPSSLAAGSRSTTVRLVVNTAAATAAKEQQSGGPPLLRRVAPLALALLVLLNASQIRRQGRHWRRMLCVGILAMGSATATLLSGCGGGFFGQAPESYTITIAATAGNLQHTATVTLNVQ